ncbi:MAG: STAS domain-containing protein [Betaproteobacteria bacterium]|nr:STAS domain-containing protein [Betaproteobacteria bacterium]MDH3435585.1 STAS domain-containing protein [Betaproteobacteria bacterium]
MIECREGRCTLRGPITINNVVALLAQGNGLFTAPGVTVDLEGVTEVDSTAVSLLLEWRREAGRHGRRIQYVNLPGNLTSLAKLYGVTELLSEG